MQRRTQIGIGLFITAIITVSLLIMVHLAIHPDKLKKHLIQHVQNSTQQAWHIDGPIHWSLFPQLNVDLNAVRLDNPPGFRGPFANIKRVRFVLSLFDLLRGRIVLKSVTFTQPTLRLARHTNGTANWDAMLPVDTAPPSPASQTDFTAALPFPLPAINVVEGTFFFIDAMHKKNWHAKNWSWHSGSADIDHPFTFNATATVLSPSVASRKPVKLALSSILTIKPKQAGVQLNNFHLKTHIPLNTQKENGINPVLEVGLKANVDWDAKNAALSVKDSTIQMDSAIMQFSLEGRHMRLPAYAIDGTLEILPFNPKELAALTSYPWRFLHPNALTYLGAKCQLRATQKEAGLYHCNIKLDNARLKADLMSTWPTLDALRFTVSADNITIDPYILLTPSPSSPTVIAANTVQHNQAPSSPTMWKTLSGQININALTWKKLTIHHFALTALEKQGVLQLSPITGELLEGKLHAGLTINTTTTPMRYTLNQKLSDIAIAPLLKALNGPTDLFNGKGSISSNLSSRGHNYDTLIHALGGKGRLEMKNGTINGLDIGRVLSQANALLHKQIFPKDTATTKTNYTAFDKLTGSFYIQNGILRNNNLQFSTPTFQATGKGYVNLPKQHIDYLIKVRGVKRAQKKENQETLQLHTWFVPVRFKGSFNRIQVLPDFTVLGKDILLDKLQKHSKGYLEKIKKNVDNTLKQWVK